MADSLVCFVSSLFPVDQRKTRDTAAVKPSGNKDKIVEDANKLKENKNDKKPEEQKKDEKAIEQVPAVEAKKAEENIFDVRVVCVSVFVIYS